MSTPQKEEASESLSALDEKLMNDQDGSFKKELLEKLKPYSENLKQKIASGALNPDEFAAAEKLTEALKQAESIIRDR